MAFALPDPETEFGARVARRLDHDMVGWLTSVDEHGMPAPAPVWFLWDEATARVLVYSQPTARRLARMRTNPRTTLHLNDDGAGHDYVVLSGRVATAPDQPPAHDNAAFVAKYADWMSNLFGSAERYAGMFSVPLTFVPERLRGD